MIKRAMILAAGEGRRMRPLTIDTPKPLLRAGKYRLIEWQLQKLAAAGIQEVVINVAYLAEQIEAELGQEAFGLKILYSREPRPLETGGALNKALPLLQGAPFLLINSDIWTDYPIRNLLSGTFPGVGAHLVLIPNPAHHPKGDFSLKGTGVKQVSQPGLSCTFSGISVFKPEYIECYPRRRETFALREVLDWLIENTAISGEIFKGEWMDIGTPERLQSLDDKLSRH